MKEAQIQEQINYWRKQKRQGDALNCASKKQGEEMVAKTTNPLTKGCSIGSVKAGTGSAQKGRTVESESHLEEAQKIIQRAADELKLKIYKILTIAL